MSTEFSYVSSPRKTPYTYKTVIDLLQEEVTLNPDKEWMIHRELDGFRESLTYKDLDSKATGLAKVLLSKGVNKGDKVALLGPNTLQKVIAEFGIILSGAAVLHLTMNMTDARDVLEIFTIGRCRLLLVDPGRDQSDAEWIPRLLDGFAKKCHEITGETEDPPILCLRSVKNIPTRLDISRFYDISVSVDLPKLYPEDIAWIFTTSGSTGKPKMVGHSHFSMINTENDFMNGRKPNSSYIKLYNDRPFGWLGGSPSFPIIYRYVRVFADSSTAMASTWDIWNIIKDEKCTHALLLPYFLSDLMQIKKDNVDPYKLDMIVTGGQIVDKYFTNVIDVFTKAMMSVYGSTEVMFATFYPLEKSRNKEVVHVGDVGKPAGGLEVKVIDETGNITKTGEPGEICIRSNCVFSGYYQDEKLNKYSFLEGNWFRNGDTGYISRDGRIIIQGRIKDIISRGTRKIMPAVIEDAILEMEGISNVAVVPVPDKRLYEEVCVCFTTTKEKEIDETSVKIFCEKQFQMENTADGLGERPRYYLKFECLPKLPTGKFDKRQIRREAIDRLQIDVETMKT